MENRRSIDRPSGVVMSGGSPNASTRRSVSPKNSRGFGMFRSPATTDRRTPRAASSSRRYAVICSPNSRPGPSRYVYPTPSALPPWHGCHGEPFELVAVRVQLGHAVRSAAS
ncbi:hypothetical protein [Kribbella sp. C-35]|uniref:hypothetical protein n=1 Tax=Kribbella sp. C-35 TaxID=2789276 RepID=UPI00397AF244